MKKFSLIVAACALFGCGDGVDPQALKDYESSLNESLTSELSVPNAPKELFADLSISKDFAPFVCQDLGSVVCKSEQIKLLTHNKTLQLRDINVSTNWIYTLPERDLLHFYAAMPEQFSYGVNINDIELAPLINELFSDADTLEGIFGKQAANEEYKTTEFYKMLTSTASVSSSLDIDKSSNLASFSYAINLGEYFIRLDLDDIVIDKLMQALQQGKCELRGMDIHDALASLLNCKDIGELSSDLQSVTLALDLAPLPEHIKAQQTMLVPLLLMSVVGMDAQSFIPAFIDLVNTGKLRVELNMAPKTSEQKDPAKLLKSLRVNGKDLTDSLRAILSK